MATITDPNERCEYNGVRFVIFSSNVQTRVVEDEALRARTCLEYTLSIEGYVLAEEGGNTEETLKAMRQRLTAPGQRLYFRNKGFGPLEVNVGRVRDVAYGPKCQLFRWQPIGHARAAEVSVKIVTKIPECDNAKYEGVMALNFRESWDLGQDGMQTLTTSGYLEIAANRKSPESNLLSDHVDLYRELTRPDVPEGFQRVSQQFTDSYDKRRLDFTYVDKQLPVPYVHGITQSTMEHAVSSQLLGGGANNMHAGFRYWKCSLSGSITVAPTQTKSWAIFAFLHVARTRFAASGNNLPMQLPGGTAPAASHRLLLPQSLQIRENIFGLDTHFQLSYDIIEPDRIVGILSSSGLWSPINTRWSELNDSLERSSFHVRGHARLGADINGDAIIDLCIPRPGQQQIPRGPRRVGPPVRPAQPGGGRLTNTTRPRPDPEDSWIGHRNRLTYSETPTRAVHPPMRPHQGGSARTWPENSPEATGPVEPYRRATGGPQGTRLPELLIVQDAAPPTGRIIMDGLALRWGHRIPIPRLVSIDGRPAIMDRIVLSREEVLTVLDGYPIYAHAWMVEYVLERPLQSDSPTLTDPFTGLTGNPGAEPLPIPLTSQERNVTLPTFIFSGE